jgi:hypothetical protein
MAGGTSQRGQPLTRTIAAASSAESTSVTCWLRFIEPNSRCALLGESAASCLPGDIHHEG